jgi:hypothetical protein
MTGTLSEYLATEARHRTATHIAIANDHYHDALVATLELAVPMRIWELEGRTPEQRAVIAKRCAQVVAERGDNLMFGSKRKGKTAAVFNALAEGLACAAYQPGGVTFAGRHWCTDHAACLAAERGEEPDPVLGECGDGYAAQSAGGRTVQTVDVAGGLL